MNREESAHRLQLINNIVAVWRRRLTAIRSRQRELWRRLLKSRDGKDLETIRRQLKS